MSLKDAFQGMKDAGTPTPKLVPRPAPAQKTGKSSNPSHEAVKIYLLKETRKAAKRKWEDASRGRRDFSDLVQHLLEEYVSS